jgi:hypothetical protein
MLFGRKVGRYDLIVGAIIAAVGAIAGVVLSILVVVKGNTDPYFISNIILAVLIIVDALMMGIGWLRGKKQLAYGAAIVGMPLFGAAVFFGNVDAYQNLGAMYESSWILGSAFTFYMVGSISVIEAFIYLVIRLLKGKDNPKFNPEENTEMASFFFAISAGFFAVVGGVHDWSFWSFFVSCVSEVALVECFATTIYLYKAEKSDSEASAS